MTTINMNTFQLPCSSTSDFMARMGVVYAAYNSFAEVGAVPKSPRSKVRMRRVLNTFTFHLKSECFPISSSTFHLKVSVSHHVRHVGLSNSLLSLLLAAQISTSLFEYRVTEIGVFCVCVCVCSIWNLYPYPRGLGVP